MDILQVISFPMRVEGATSPMFVYGEPAERVIFVRAALISVEEAARISRECVPNDGGDIKEHDGSVREGLTSFQGHFPPVDDRAFEYLPFAHVRVEKTPPWRQEHKRRHVRSSARADGQERTGRSTRLKRSSTQFAGPGERVARAAEAMMQASVVAGIMACCNELGLRGRSMVSSTVSCDEQLEEAQREVPCL